LLVEALGVANTF